MYNSQGDKIDRRVCTICLSRGIFLLQPSFFFASGFCCLVVFFNCLSEVKFYSHLFVSQVHHSHSGSPVSLRGLLWWCYWEASLNPPCASLGLLAFSETPWFGFLVFVYVFTQASLFPLNSFQRAVIFWVQNFDFTCQEYSLLDRLGKAQGLIPNIASPSPPPPRTSWVFFNP